MALALALALALAGCGAGGGSNVSSSPLRVSSSVAAPRATPVSPGLLATGAPSANSAPPAAFTAFPAPPTSGAPSCATWQLEVTVGGGSGGAAGSIITAVLLTNRSTAACTLNGYPGVSFVGGSDGHQVGRAAHRDGSRPAAVTLAPGAHAHATLRVVNYQALDRATCQPTATTGYRIYPPNQTTAAFVRHAGTSCAATIPIAGLLTVGPVQAGPPTQ